MTTSLSRPTTTRSGVTSAICVARPVGLRVDCGVGLRRMARRDRRADRYGREDEGADRGSGDAKGLIHIEHVRSP